MANPVTDKLKDWLNDADAADTNLPIVSTQMGTGQSGELAGELRRLKSEMRSLSIIMSWERWLGLKNLAATGNIAFTYSSATVFTVNDDFLNANRLVAVVGRRVRAFVTAGTIYGTIAAASFGSPTTTVTVDWDSGGALDAGLTEVQFGPELRAMPSQPLTLTNKTGGSLAVGDVVAIDSGNDSAVALANTLASQKQLVVSLDAPANNVAGRFAAEGIVNAINVTGTVTGGNYLVKSATTKVAEDSGVAQGDTTPPPAGAFAIAMSASGGGGSVAGKLLGQTTRGYILIPVKVWLPAASVDGTAAAPVFDLPESNAPVATSYGTSPHKFGALDFAKGGSALNCQFNFHLPSDWTATGGIDVGFIWFSETADNTKNVVWTLRTKSIADGDDVLNPTFNGEQTVVGANGATANTRLTAGLAADTTGMAAGETATFRVGRDPTSGSDTLSTTAKLMGITLRYNRLVAV